MATSTKNLQKEIKKTASDALDSAKSTADSVQRELADAAGDARDAVQKVFLAGLGALAVTGEEGSKMFKTLVSKGEGVELPGLGGERILEARKQLAERADKAADKAQNVVDDARNTAVDTAVGTVNQAEDRIQDVVASVMKRLGVPTRDEITSLTESVEKLTERVERLKESRAKETVVIPTPNPVLEAPLLVPVGGGWYEVRLGDEVIEKVQGKTAGEEALTRAKGKLVG